MIVEIPDDNSIVKWKMNDNDEWKSAEISDLIKAYEERPQGEYVDISKLRLMTVEECEGHTIDYAMGWKACIEWIKRGCDKE